MTQQPDFKNNVPFSTFDDIVESKETSEAPTIENESKRKMRNISASDQSKIVLGTYSEAPDYWRDNEYIFSGYVLNCSTVPKVFRSLFMLHNEAMNIWTHLIGSLLVCCLVLFTAMFITSNYTSINQVIDIEKMISEIKDVTSPWIASLNTDINQYQAHESTAVDSIIQKTKLLFNEINEKFKIGASWENYIESVKSIITKAKEKVLIPFSNDWLDKWPAVQKKLLAIIQSDDLEINSVKKLSDSNDDDDDNNNQLRRWPVFVMLFSAIICLSCSAIFHLFGWISKPINTVLSRLDYSGIAILIAGSCYPPYFYFFYCERFWAIIYWSFISLFAIGVFGYSLTPDFHQPERRSWRGILFLTLGLSAGLPIWHWLFFKSNVSGFENSPRLIFWYLGGASYVTGALMYINRIPEKFRPGKHDTFGASHQIFHILVLCGVVLHYFGSLDAFYFRVTNTCPKSIW